ncbi:hypothetical protein D3C75_343270 [compost metagenome]
MHIVRVATKDELKELLEWIFFRPEGGFTEICEARLSFEEISGILGIRERDLAPEGLEICTDEWDEFFDAFDAEELKDYILSDKLPLVRDFTPGILTWCLEDDFDRLGDVNIRVFIFTPDEEASASSHRRWRAEQQADYEYHCDIEDRLALLKSQQ